MNEQNTPIYNINIKIGRHQYIITKDDKFMDNGVCIQLLTQSKEKSNWGQKPTPILSKKVVKELFKEDLVFYKNIYGNGIQIFGLK